MAEPIEASSSVQNRRESAPVQQGAPVTQSSNAPRGQSFAGTAGWAGPGESLSFSRETSGYLPAARTPLVEPFQQAWGAAPGPQARAAAGGGQAFAAAGGGQAFAAAGQQPAVDQLAQNVNQLRQNINQLGGNTPAPPMPNADTAVGNNNQMAQNMNQMMNQMMQTMTQMMTQMMQMMTQMMNQMMNGMNGGNNQNNNNQNNKKIDGNNNQNNNNNNNNGTTPINNLPALKRPNGLNEIINTFGQAGTNQTTMKMPAGPGGKMINVTCNGKIADRMKAAFEEIKAAGLSDNIKSFDGCFNNRAKRGGSSKSTHAWGIAFDLNASQNPMGSTKQTEGQRKLAAIFEKYGFYQLPNDPMHFQYCRGY